MAATSAKSDGFATAKLCPICGKKSKCAVSRDGKAALCWTVSSDRQTPNGSFYHWLTDERSQPFLTQRKKPKPIGISNSSRFQTFSKLQKISQELREGLVRWAIKRSITTDSLVAIGAIPTSFSLKYPEREASAPHDVLGINERYWDPIKHDDGSLQRFGFSGHRGFQFSDSHKSAIPLLLIVEGFADVCSAIDAGFCVIGRCTRYADLVPLVQRIKSVEKHYRIVLLCENDEAKPGRKTPLEEVQERASQLQNACGRPILVASPPREHKDLNDWWVALTNGLGHELAEKDRLTHGRVIEDFLLKEVRQQVTDRNREICQVQTHSVELKAEIFRAERRPQNVDMDYDVSNSCGYRKVLIKPQPNDELAVMGANLACGCWSCWSCRNRMLIPNWIIKLEEAFCSEIGVFSRWLTDEESETMKRDMRKSGGKWVLIRSKQTTEPDEVLPLEKKGLLCIASQPIRGNCEYHDFHGDADGFSLFCDWLELVVASVDSTQPKPITSCRSIQSTEKITAEHWMMKIQKIVSEKTVFAGLASKETVDRIRSDSYKSQNLVGVVPIEFIWIEKDSVTLALCSHSFEGALLSPVDAVNRAKEMLVDEYRAGASKRWYPRACKGWAPTEGKGGPSEIRAAAKKFSRPVREWDPGALSSMVDSVVVRIPIEAKQDFLSEVHK